MLAVLRIVRSTSWQFLHVFPHLLLLATFAAGCGVQRADESHRSVSVDTTAILKEVEAAVWRFHAADTARDAEAVVDLLSPSFYMFVDGARADYQTVAQGSHEFMQNLDLFHTEWTDLRITPLGSDYAVSSFSFRDSIRTKDGTLIRNSGPTTLVWSRENEQWLVVYADADHYPVSP